MSKGTITYKGNTFEVISMRKLGTGEMVLHAKEVLLPVVPDFEPPELGENSRMEWMGYTIKRKRDFEQGHPKPVGYVVTKSGCNVMPGACWFETVAGAQQGIAAFILARKIHPLDNPLNCDGDTFWALMELTKGGDK